ncbi:MAG TPA: metalloregulator ArsR/SmtB family transcription factor [Thermoanaerobaculia bacterium]|jgi:DNA-binding transcriptional ArsR family regulator|nr:metalloregulator ArsR/SmtB family transcription factor [Thermoanaerobaculia bacterium]
MWARRSNGAAAAAPEGAAPVFAALGDPTRLRLVGRLSREGPLSISRLSVGAGVTRQAVTKHLRVLAGAGLARGTRQGREQRWQLQAEPLDEARRSLERISQRWDEALGRLQAAVEGD